MRNLERKREERAEPAVMSCSWKENENVPDLDDLEGIGSRT